MSVPSYWKSPLKEGIEKVKKLRLQAGQDGVCFGVITDVHWELNAKNSPVLLQEVLTECNVPYYLNLGDIIRGWPYCTKEYIYEEYSAWRKAFEATEEKESFIFGNHDGAYSELPEPYAVDQNLSKQEMLEWYYTWQRKHKNKHFGADGTYFYLDDKKAKTRFICLNTHDVPSFETDEKGRAIYNTFRCFCIREEQLRWLAHEALALPSQKWQVLLFSHENATAVEKHKTRNHDLILGILQAFRNGEVFNGETNFDDQPYYNAKISVDFTGRGGEFVAWISGHIHEDKIINDNGVVCVATLNDSCAFWLNNHGTAEEQAFDIFVVDKKRKKVNIVRFGVGTDRAFTY